MTKLELIIKGNFIAEIEIEIPRKRVTKSFRENYELKRAYVDEQKGQFKIDYLRQIIRANYDYEIYLTITKEPQLVN